MIINRIAHLYGTLRGDGILCGGCMPFFSGIVRDKRGEGEGILLQTREERFSRGGEGWVSRTGI